MAWNILIYEDFEEEILDLSQEVRQEILAMAELLAEFGPELSRPHVDTLNGSNHANMKELRFKADNGVWRIAFAFDPRREAILLVSGDKSGMSQKLFYKRLIKKADQRYDAWLNKIKED